MQSADVVEERLPGGRILFFFFQGSIHCKITSADA